MKILSLVTLVSRDKDGKKIERAPGVVDVDDATGINLIKLGQAKTLEDAKAQAAAESSGPSVKTVPSKKSEDKK